MGSQSLRIERLRELATTLNPDCASARDIAETTLKSISIFKFIVVLIMENTEIYVL
jgi:hypothetical protein